MDNCRRALSGHGGPIFPRYCIYDECNRANGAMNASAANASSAVIRITLIATVAAVGPGLVGCGVLPGGSRPTGSTQIDTRKCSPTRLVYDIRLVRSRIGPVWPASCELIA